MNISRPVAGLWAITVALVVAHLVAVEGSIADATYLAAVLIAPVAAWVGVRMAPPEARGVPTLVAAAVTCAGLGDLLWQIYVWAGADPDVSSPDILYYASYLGLGAAVLVVAVRDNVDRRRVDLDAVIDALTVVTVTVLVLWTPLADDIVDDRSRPLVSRMVEGGYPVLDAVLLALVLRALSVPHRRRLAPLMAVGVGCWLASDFSYSVVSWDGLPRAVIDIGWMVGAALLATASWWREPPPPRPPELEGLDRDVYSQLSIAILPLAVPPLFLVLNWAAGRELELPGAVAASLVLVLFALVRTERLLRSERRSRAELADARDVALAASRAKSAFLATMSHEIRTPLNGVIGLNELLLTTRLDERQQQYSEGVRSSGRALLDVINDVLDFSRIESGHLELEEIDFDLVQLVEDVAEMVSEPAQAKRLELLADCSPALPRGVRGDPARLRQVLLNLAGNAVKFTPAGEVLIRAHLAHRAEGELLFRFEIVDTGIGIAEENRARLFDPYAQADSSITRRYGGSGLGLAICRQLVEAMGGTLGVVSTPGSGSTFWFSVPLRPARDTAVPAPRPTRGLAGRRVLVVDDNKTNLAILNDQLRHWGMTVDVADSGHRALVQLRRASGDARPYDLVLVDQVMPEMDGVELARTIAGDRVGARAAVVLMTSGPAMSETEARASSVAVALTKPVLPSRLRETLARLLADSAPEPEARRRRSGMPEGLGRVLVVDDGELNRLVAVGILELLGYTTEAVADGHQALGVLAENDFDAVLMDVQMPIMDGYQTTETLRRAEGDGRRTPVIAMTATAVAGERERCLDAGMDDYLSKPISRGSVSAVMERWVPARVSG